MPLDLWIALLEGMHMMRVLLALPFAEIASARDAIFAQRLVAQVLHGIVLRIHPFNIPDYQQDINDRLGFDAGDSLAANVLNGDHIAPEYRF